VLIANNTNLLGGVGGKDDFNVENSKMRPKSAGIHQTIFIKGN